MDQFEDVRKRKSYSVSELVMGGIALFLFKENTRNGFNYERKEQKFRENYIKMFKLRIPHMDTVDAFLKILSCDELEHLKTAFVIGLIELRVLHRFKVLGKYTIAVDATGSGTYKNNDAEKTRIAKTSKNDKTSYSYYVLEAKLVTPSGMAISLATEWIANDGEKNYDKQDCEHSAFKRLALKLKAHFPRLPMCLLADGLYPNKTFMQICYDNGWDYVQNLQEATFGKNRTKFFQYDYKWIDIPLEYASNKTHWFSCTETITEFGDDKKAKIPQDAPTRYVFLTNIAVNGENVARLTSAGRRRWKIENEGYNVQKNHGYNLGHKFSRTSFTAYRNYYQCMQIAHAINQLVEQSKPIADFFKDPKLSVRFVWEKLVEWLFWVSIDETQIQFKDNFQIRFAE